MHLGLEHDWLKDDLLQIHFWSLSSIWVETDSNFLKRQSIFPKVNVSIIINFLSKTKFDLHIPEKIWPVF